MCFLDLGEYDRATQWPQCDKTDAHPVSGYINRDLEGAEKGDKALTHRFHVLPQDMCSCAAGGVLPAGEWLELVPDRDAGSRG